MLKFCPTLIVCGYFVTVSPLWSQTSTNVSTNSFVLALAPPANTLMVTQTVNAVYLTVLNPGIWTNVTVNWQVGTNTALLLDDGNAPDLIARDSTYSGSLVVPPFPVTTNFNVLFLISGQDLSVTNDAGELLPGATVTNTAQVTYLAGVRPYNDNFAKAIKLAPEGALVQGSNFLATIEPAEPLHGNDPVVASSVWWTWSPPVNENVLIDTAGSSFLPVLAVYTGASLDTLKLVAASTNDTVNGLKAHVNFDAAAFVTYRIAVAGFDTNGTGSIRLRVEPGGQPDTEPPLITILTPGSESLVTTNVITVIGTAKEIGAYDTGVSQVLVQVNGQPPITAAGTTNWSATATLSVGTNVILAYAQDIAGNVSSPFASVVRYVNPINDDLANALLLVSLAGTVYANNTYATLEPGEPPHARNEGGHSIWYSFQPPAAGGLHLTTEGSDFDTLLSLYTGDTVSNLTELAANDDAFAHSGWSELTASLIANQDYHIAIDGYGGATGNIQLSYTFTTASNYFSLTIRPTSGGNISLPSGLYAAGSTQLLAAIPIRDYLFAGWQGSLTSTQNPLSLILTQNYTVQPTFLLKNYTDDFETGHLSQNLNWSLSQDTPWNVQANYVYRGRFAARSGPIGDSQSSSLILEADLAAGTGSFAVKVSSEAGWDYLKFYVNGALQQQWSGDLNWQIFSFPVSAGHNQLEWRYNKDANFSNGLDAAFIDDLYLPLSNAALAARLSISTLPNDQYIVQVQGYPNRAYSLEVSSDLVTWTTIYTTNTGDNGAFEWPSPPATNSMRQFYQAVLK